MKADYDTSVERLARNLAGNAVTDALEGGTGQLDSLSDFAYALAVLFDDVDYDETYDTLQNRALAIIEGMEAELRKRG